jgi:asparagine synthetase B (glutamine-hydrolysing)
VVLDRPTPTARESAADPREIIRWFIGTSCRCALTGGGRPLRWALLTPDQRVGLTGWSVHGDERGTCVLEGAFFDTYDGISCRTAGGGALAARFLDDFLRSPESAVSKLNGIFSGLCYDRSAGWLSFFVDRTGVRQTFWHLSDRGLAVFTDFGGTRGLGGLAPTFDARSVYETMTLGVILEDRTPLAGVRLVPPGMVAVFDGSAVRYDRYWRWPPRQRSAHIRESARRIADAFDDHLRRAKAHLEAPVGIALSGGRDSRLLMSGLLRNGVPFEALTFKLIPADEDLAVATRLCAAKDITLHVADHSDPRSGNLAAMPDGAATSLGESAGFGGIRLAASAAAHFRTLLVGQDGDPLSGSFANFQPADFSTLDALFAASFDSLGAPRPEEDVASMLAIDTAGVTREDARRTWIAMYDRAFSELPYDVFLDHRLRYLNRRRWVPRTTVADLTVCGHLPFMDRQIQDVYLSLPIRHVRYMRAHTLATYIRDASLGRIPLANRPMPLWLEWRLGPQLSRFKAARDRRKRRATLSPPPQSGPSIYADLLDAWADGARSLHTPRMDDVRRTLHDRPAVSGATINRLLSHCVIERLFVNREVASLPPFFLIDVQPRDVSISEWKPGNAEVDD